MKQDKRRGKSYRKYYQQDSDQKSEIKKRKCLDCDQYFRSMSKFNRVCNSCKIKIDHQAEEEYGIVK